ncbi:hypothetical protein FXF53_30170 [Micromonospora sp. WP24]|uniref:hypothetical protein n=1 Tax=Micromonospora sp. WP24 TaxID=2604469 RepID=UPI0011D976F1|nr:hypothetical protein [Micromonospora sp. WP24]TYB91459.1 hypothetical protein FXF53_30170 [Micromonospora sp. WP24]
MPRLNWTTLRRDNSGPNCPAIATDGDNVYLRNSENTEYVAKFPAASFETLKQKIRDGEI